MFLAPSLLNDDVLYLPDSYFKTTYQKGGRVLSSKNKINERKQFSISNRANISFLKNNNILFILFKISK
jgi:hypothetical protein